MRWNRIVGQDHAKAILIAALRNGRLAHAYCIWGPSGVGKDALAIEVARVVNCSNPIETPESIEACNQCRNCVLMDSLQHPNVQLIFSLPAAGRSAATEDESPLLRLSDEHIALLQEQLAIKARNPYHDIRLPNATQIRIASIRDVRRTLQLSAPNQSGWRVVIISEADAMTTEAANAFLKTLEEPHPRTTLILTTSRRDHLPPTILSRCQHIHCGYLSDDQIAAALVERYGVPIERASIIATLAQGSFSRAIELVHSSRDIEQFSDFALKFLRTVAKPTRYRTELFGLVEQITSSADRTAIVIQLQMILAWLRDAHMLQSLGAAAANRLVFRFGDPHRSLQRFVEHYYHASLAEAINAVDDAIAAVESNAQVPLTLITLALRLRRALKTVPHSSS
ncbi:MAG: AAA family ATPase [Chlorobi bacterium]|nr:AAA family ATPase [Chlorobiota bacterium]